MVSILAAGVRVALVVASLSVGAWAQTDQPAAQPEKPLLSGPKVEEPKAAATLVKRDFQGALERLEARPEKAAAELLGLTDEENKPVEKLFTERAAAVEKLLYDNLSLFLEIQAARQGGAGRPGSRGADEAEYREKARKMRELAGPLAEPLLTDQVAAVLPAEKVAEFRRIVTEYVEALAAEGAKEQRAAAGGDGGEMDKPGPDRPRRGPVGGGGAMVVQRMETNLLLREMARSLGALVAERREQTDELIKTVQATEEQEAEIRKILRESGEKNGPRPTQEQRAETMRRIMELLTPEQRQALIRSRRP